MSSTQITHVIFDVDGLLLDTERVYFNILSEMAKKHNVVFTHSMQSQLMGLPSKDMAVNFSKVTSIDPIHSNTLLDEYIDKISYRLEDCSLLPGTQQLIEHLSKHNIPMALATGSETNDFKSKTKKHKEFFDQFEHVVLSDDVELKKGKPSPDIYLLAMSRFTKKKPLSSRNVLVFEDSVGGVLAAVKANTEVVMIPSLPIDLVKDKVPLDRIEIIESILDFEPEKYGLPKIEQF